MSNHLAIAEELLTAGIKVNELMTEGINDPPQSTQHNPWFLIHIP